MRVSSLKVLVLVPLLSLAVLSADAPAPKIAQAAPAASGSPVQDLILFTKKYATNVPPQAPGPYDSNVTMLAAHVLQQTHYAKHPIDDEISEKFLHRYLDLLDGAHFHFLQSDVQEFQKYKHSLDDLTLKSGDTQPANEMFARFLSRVEQRVAFAAELLKSETWEFTGNDKYMVNRKNADWPESEEAARQLWRQHIRYEYLQEKLNKQKPEEIIKTLSNRYKRMLRNLGEFDTDDILQLYLTSLAQAYDPHSDYMGKDQLENFAISMKLSLFGIGALLRSEDGYCKVQELLAGGPALRSKKMKVNDRIIAVQQKGQEPVDVVDMKLNKVVEMIRGAKGTEVSLTIIPADAPDPSERKVVTLVRDEIKLEDQEAKAKIVEQPDEAGKISRVGVIDLPSFYASFDLGSNKGKSEPRSTTADVAKLLKKLMAEHVSGVILDLRRNGGGSLEEAIKLTGLFIKEGPVVQVRDARDDVNVENDPDPTQLYDGPLIVLTSRFSASASEILAAALQDYGRALIVGENGTHGKGTVQTIYELNRFLLRNKFPANYNPGALKVTIRKFYRANGSSTQLKGVTPDIILPSVNNYREIGEPYQEYALAWDTIPGAKFERYDRVLNYLGELRKLSQSRLDKDPDFAYMREDIDQYRKLLAENSVSLNEDQRRKEKEVAEGKTKARKEERASRKTPKPVTYELTLKLADQPGLPAPMSVTNSIAKAEGAADSTNTTHAAGSTDGVDGEPEDKDPAIDVVLEETKHVLMDYAKLLGATSKPSITLSN